MTIQTGLKRLLDETPGVTLVAFGDLSSGLILDTAAKAACPREVLDLLCEKAIDCFALLGPDARPVTGDNAIFGKAVIHFDDRGLQVFARQPENPDDVICAITDPGGGLEQVLQSTLALAREMAAPP